MPRISRPVVTLLVAALVTFGTALSATAAEPPDLVAVIGSNTITQGRSAYFLVEVIGYQTGGSFVVGGDGVEPLRQHGGVKPSRDANVWRIKFEASPDAPVGLRDLTVINPDGQSDTLVDVIEVLPGTVVPDTGVSGHVFADVDGDGTKDETEPGLAGVEIRITDAAGSASTHTTDASGNFVATGLAPGGAEVAYTAPPEATLTTGNDLQAITVVSQTVTAAAEVGYQGAPGPAVEILEVSNQDVNVARGSTKTFRVTHTGADPAAAWSFSGYGITVTRAVTGQGVARVTFAVAADADLGLHDLTVVNPDGAADTLVGAVNIVE